MMTLEDFLAKAEAVEEEDVKPSVQVPPMATTTEGLSSGTVYAFGPVMQCPHPPPAAMVEVVAGRGKRRGVQILEPVDSLVQQRQERMIKNRESAARSREKKQAHQDELESLVGNLEEENKQLQREKIEWKRERYKQLLEVDCTRNPSGELLLFACCPLFLFSRCQFVVTSIHSSFATKKG